ncbi:unnamed protein product [Effrenium voratum]|nr:unnamed protein product [Effrenium voratum]
MAVNFCFRSRSLRQILDSNVRMEREWSQKWKVQLSPKVPRGQAQAWEPPMGRRCLGASPATRRAATTPTTSWWSRTRREAGHCHRDREPVQRGGRAVGYEGLHPDGGGVLVGAGHLPHQPLVQGDETDMRLSQHLEARGEPHGASALPPNVSSMMPLVLDLGDTAELLEDFDPPGGPRVVRSIGPDGTDFAFKTAMPKRSSSGITVGDFHERFSLRIETCDRDDPLQAAFRLDGVVCVCDASTFEELEGDSAAGEDVARLLREQLAISDVCLLNKCDLIDAARRDLVSERVRKVNPSTRVVPCRQGKVNLAQVLKVNSFSLDGALSLETRTSWEVPTASPLGMARGTRARATRGRSALMPTAS